MSGLIESAPLLSSSSSQPTLKRIQPLAFILNVQMTVKTADVSTFLAAIKPAYDAVLREPQCAFFNLGQRHPLNPLTGEVLNTVGDVLGTVTNLIDGTTVVDAAGNVVGKAVRIWLNWNLPHAPLWDRIGSPIK